MSKNHRHYVHLCTLVFQNVKVTSMQHQSIFQQQLEHVKFKALDGELVMSAYQLQNNVFHLCTIVSDLSI